MANTIGIDALSFYVPENRIAIADIISLRSEEDTHIQHILQRAQKTTHQEYLRLNDSWQDSVCLAAQSALSLIADAEVDISHMRYVNTSTETPVDVSKPLSMFMLGIFKQRGHTFPRNLVSYQTQHACAGGSISILQILSMMSTDCKKNSHALVTMSDISRYRTHTSAEITQGAGAVSLCMCENPRLLEIDIHVVGYSSEDVDDFFRPVDSPVAIVKGSYSIQCYISAVYEALLDYAQHADMSLEEVFQQVDYLVFHTPFATMPSLAIRYILKRHLRYSEEDIVQFIEKKKLVSSAEIIRHIGNTYTAAAYFVLGNLLQQEYDVLGDALTGKKILVVSYGSGNTAVVFCATVAPHAPQVIQQWNLSAQLDAYQDMSTQKYNQWCEHYDAVPVEQTHVSTHSGKVHLKEIRNDGYRIYGA